MNEFEKAAKVKLQQELAHGKFDPRGAAMKNYVKNALVSFAEQDGEFAQAIAQGGSFEDCMKAVTKGVGSSISDLDAYQRAAEFYFPGAKVRFQMTIDLIGDAAGTEIAAAEEKPKKGIILDLADFL